MLNVRSYSVSFLSTSQLSYGWLDTPRSSCAERARAEQEHHTVRMRSSRLRPDAMVTPAAAPCPCRAPSRRKLERGGNQPYEAKP